MHENPPKRLGIASCGVVRTKDHKILITKRSPELSYPNAWVFAGGRLDKNETLEQAAQREVLEESGINVKELSSHSELIFMYEAFNWSPRSNRFSHYLIFYYLFDLSVNAEELHVKVQSDEVSEYRWVDSEELRQKVIQGMDLMKRGEPYGGEGELEGLHPNKNGTGLAEGGFQVLMSIFGLFGDD